MPNDIPHACARCGSPISDAGLSRCIHCTGTGPAYDPVNRPFHYNNHPSGVECITIVEHYPYNVGNAIKYLWRAGRKEGADELEDLRKAQWYVAREIQRRERKTS